MTTHKPRQRASGVPTAELLVVGQCWRRNGTMRFLTIDRIDTERGVVHGAFQDGAVVVVTFTHLRRVYTRIVP